MTKISKFLSMAPANNQTNPLPRIGQIDFSNCLPINLPIEKGRVKIEAEFISRVPSQLNQLIVEEKLDISAVSLYCYLNSPSLSLVPGISVSSLTEVGSVLFFYEGSLDDLKDKPLLVPTSSATSINLLSIILNKEASIEAKQIPVKSPDLPNSDSKGALVIGDYALKVDTEWSKKYNRIDLGKWWYENFRLPMVFGVWAIRKKFLESESNESKVIIDSLNRSRDIGLSDMLPDVVREASKHMNLNQSRVEKYFTEELDYTLGEKHMESIRLYKKLCLELNLLEEPNQLEESGISS